MLGKRIRSRRFGAHGSAHGGALSAVVLGCIGCGTATAQLGPPDPPPRPQPVVSLPQRDVALDEIDSTLVPEGRASWQLGWERAQVLGRVVVPPLVFRYESSEADYRRRLLLLAAIGVAGGTASDELLCARLVRGDDQREELIVLQLLAMGPARPGPCEPLRALLDRPRPEPLTTVAACLASRRFPQMDLGLPPRWYRSEDPGIAAAVRFARPLESDRALGGWFRRSDAEAMLVQRAAFLGGELGRFDGAEAARLREVLRQRGLGSSEVRAAAALQLSTADAPGEWLEEGEFPVDPEIAPILAVAPAFRAELMRRGLLAPPPDRLDPLTRVRTALAFALACDGPRLRATVGHWRGDDIAAALCLGVAWRFSSDPASADPTWIELLPEVREREWVRIACGLEPGDAATVFADPRLDLAFRAACDERLPPIAALEAIEAALWRSGAHLGRWRVDAEDALIRDLLLAGSTYGASVLGRSEDAYLPKGLSAGDMAFEVGFELWRFLSEPARRPPAGDRLR